MSEELLKIREKIDALDEQIQELINQRARCAEEVARVKRAAEADPDFYRPEREAQVLRAVKARNRGPLADVEMARLFREIMSACLALEQPMKVAYFGPAGSYTHAAAIRHFGGSVTTVPLGAIDEVFREVAAGGADYGVVPVENSTEGVINHTLDMFLQSPLRICGEVELRIHHNLLGRGVSLEEVTRIYAHPQALAQCREWLDANLPHVEREAVSNNAEGARMAAAEAGTAAIAGANAAGLYGLEILAGNIEDEPDNTTRFLVIGDRQVPASGEDKTTLLLSAHNRPGALASLLAPLARHEISMSRIESRPSRRGMWDYVFFIDLLGHAEEPSVVEALKELNEEASFLKILGSYPRSAL
ncbi:prephenate dehydratase [Endothiovibrio diazotrophicus]